jgi:hypothetical protein
VPRAVLTCCVHVAQAVWPQGEKRLFIRLPLQRGAGAVGRPAIPGPPGLSSAYNLLIIANGAEESIIAGGALGALRWRRCLVDGALALLQ